MSTICSVINSSSSESELKIPETREEHARFISELKSHYRELEKCLSDHERAFETLWGETSEAEETVPEAAAVSAPASATVVKEEAPVHDFIDGACVTTTISATGGGLHTHCDVPVPVTPFVRASDPDPPVTPLKEERAVSPLPKRKSPSPTSAPATSSKVKADPELVSSSPPSSGKVKKDSPSSSTNRHSPYAARPPSRPSNEPPLEEFRKIKPVRRRLQRTCEVAAPGDRTLRREAAVTLVDLGSYTKFEPASFAELRYEPVPRSARSYASHYLPEAYTVPKDSNGSKDGSGSGASGSGSGSGNGSSKPAPSSAAGSSKSKKRPFNAAEDGGKDPSPRAKAPRTDTDGSVPHTSWTKVVVHPIPPKVSSASPSVTSRVSSRSTRSMKKKI